ncbi:MAG: hypothetical protein Q9157_000643 [Trypethelium eluteriae]
MDDSARSETSTSDEKLSSPQPSKNELAISQLPPDSDSSPKVHHEQQPNDQSHAAPQLLTGKIYTRFSTKWTFLVFLGIFELGSVLCGAAVSSRMLIVARAVAGMGAAGITTGAITIISSCAPLEKRPALIGYLTGFNQLGLVAGPLIGGAFTSYTTWRWCFYVNIPVGAVAAVAIALLHIPEQTTKASPLSVLRRLHHYLDLVGFVLFAPAVLQLLLALQYGGNVYAWNSSQVIGLFCGSAATSVVWIFWNYSRGKDASLPFSLIGQTAVWTSGIYQALIQTAIYGIIYFLPIYFQAVDNASPMLSGVYLLPTILSQLVMAVSSGKIMSTIGYALPSAIFSTVFLSVASGLYSLLGPNSPVGEWIGFQIIGGIGSGAGLQVAIVAVQAVIKGPELPSAMAFLVCVQFLGPAIALALYNVIFDTSLRSQLTQKAPHLNATAIIDSGATGFRDQVQPSDLPPLLSAYATSIDRVFYLVTGLSAARIICLWGMGWHDIRKKKPSVDPETTNDGK